MALGISPFVDQAGKPQALGEDQQAYLDFLGTLDGETREGAKRDGPVPAEVPGVGKPRPTSGDRVGVRFVELSEATQAAAWKVLDTVYDRLDPELAWMRRASARAQAKDIFFSWSGTGLAFRPNAYRIEGRDFTFDFVNAQDEGNHVHTLYREGGRDFGQEVPIWTRVASGQFFTEGPVWSPPSTLLFSDMRFDGTAGHIVSLNESGKLQRLWSSPKVANGLMFDGEGRLWACLFGHGTLASFAWQDGALVDERTEIPGHQGQRFLKTNDLVFDASGGLWFTDPLFGRKAGEQPVMGVYYRRPTGEISLVIEDLDRPNGIMLSPGEETLYVLPSSGSSAFAYDITAPGMVANRRAFGQVPGGGDGMTVDALGNVYLTSGRLRSVVVVNPAGEEVDRIGLPGGPSNVCFGGPANRTLFVTAGDSVYAVPRKQPGWIFPGSRAGG
jgi:gluconolactonase